LPYARHLPARWRWSLAFWLTDETFAVVEHQLRQQDNEFDGAWYWLGSSLAMYGNWQLWTVIGVLLGQSVPGLADLGLDFRWWPPCRHRRCTAEKAAGAGGGAAGRVVALLARELPFAGADAGGAGRVAGACWPSAGDGAKPEMKETA
jgi:hypothetical protein